MWGYKSTGHFCSASYQPAQLQLLFITGSSSSDTFICCSRPYLSPPLPPFSSASRGLLQHGGSVAPDCLSTGFTGGVVARLPGRPPPQHLCGSHLVDALYLVCGDHGFFYNPKTDVDPPLGLLAPKDGAATATGGDGEVAKLSVLERCCFRPCNIFDLQNYCN